VSSRRPFALAATAADAILPLREIAPYLCSLCCDPAGAPA
jgi:hypothetical protein